jgi:AcrR family transcriptional regulator
VGSETTRERILTVAWQVARARGSVDFTLAEVANEAGVSRQAVYLHFASRPGLLLEMARSIDHRAGFVTAVAAARQLPPRRGFEQVLRLWFEHLGEILPVARALEAAAVTGADGAGAYQDRMEAWRETLQLTVAALADAGQLRPEWSVAEAADWLWARTHPAAYEFLVSNRGWSAKAVADRTVESVIHELIRPTRQGTRSSRTDHRAG